MTTKSRLDAYLSTEAEILKSQETRMGDRTWRRAELNEVRAAISALQRQLAAEVRAKAGRGSLGVSYANLNGHQS